MGGDAEIRWYQGAERRRPVIRRTNYVQENDKKYKNYNDQSRTTSSDGRATHTLGILIIQLTDEAPSSLRLGGGVASGTVRARSSLSGSGGSPLGGGGGGPFGVSSTLGGGGCGAGGSGGGASGSVGSPLCASSTFSGGRSGGGGGSAAGSGGTSTGGRVGGTTNCEVDRVFSRPVLSNGDKHRLVVSGGVNRRQLCGHVRILIHRGGRICVLCRSRRGGRR